MLPASLLLLAFFQDTPAQPASSQTPRSVSLPMKLNFWGWWVKGDDWIPRFNARPFIPTCALSDAPPCAIKPPKPPVLVPSVPPPGDSNQNKQ
jgi:hypothetical protein